MRASGRVPADERGISNSSMSQRKGKERTAARLPKSPSNSLTSRARHQSPKRSSRFLPFSSSSSASASFPSSPSTSPSSTLAPSSFCLSTRACNNGNRLVPSGTNELGSARTSIEGDGERSGYGLRASLACPVCCKSPVAGPAAADPLTAPSAAACAARRLPRPLRRPPRSPVSLKKLKSDPLLLELESDSASSSPESLNSACSVAFGACAGWMEAGAGAAGLSESLSDDELPEDDELDDELSDPSELMLVRLRRWRFRFGRPAAVVVAGAIVVAGKLKVDEEKERGRRSRSVTRSLSCTVDASESERNLRSLTSPATSPEARLTERMATESPPLYNSSLFPVYCDLSLRSSAFPASLSPIQTGKPPRIVRMNCAPCQMISLRFANERHGPLRART